MLKVLSNRTYRHLFTAQIIALVGTGLATIALGLLAYDIAGGDAGAVLGTALAIKMAAYIGVAPVVGAFADRLPRRRFLVAMDMIRMAVAILLPFVDQIWHIYVLIFVLQSASAAFTPTFQATIPDVLPDEAEYTRALSLSRLAYDMESLVSPILAAALLTVISYNWLFEGTAIGFLISALMIVSVRLPVTARRSPGSGGIWGRTLRGTRMYLATPRLRGLLALTLSAAAASAMVIVNTVVIVRDLLDLTQRDFAIALGAYGGGSILAALILPRLLDRVDDRPVMIGAAILLTIVLAGLSVAGFFTSYSWALILSCWFLLGVAYSMSVTPAGRLLRRSTGPEDRPEIFAAQFALSHVCWLIAYPLVGLLGAAFGQAAAFGGMTLLAAAGVIGGMMLWPRGDQKILPHTHDDLPPDHPHLIEGHAGGVVRHAFVIDDLHPQWPGRV